MTIARRKKPAPPSSRTRCSRHASISRARNLPTLADDGGLKVDALGGEPGVRSHRWLGGDAAAHRDLDRALADEVIRRMAGVADRRGAARVLRAAAALVYRERRHEREVAAIHERVSEAALEGVIANRVWPRMRKGFPYRAVLFLPERGCYLGELSDEDEARLSQRRTALSRACAPISST